MDNSDRQVVIYLDNPNGQIMQTTLSDYRCYWQHIGWKILGRPPELKLEYAPTTNEQGAMF